MARDVCLIVNPHAGGGRAEKRLPAVESVLRALVLTGVSSAQEAARADPKPTYVAASLAALVLG